MKQMYKELIKGGNIVFRLDREFGYAHERDVLKNAWKNPTEEQDEQVIAQCLVTGKRARIVETHDKIKGVVGCSSDSALVAINSPAANAYDSYGKSKAYNAPVGEEAVFKYTTALNYLLGSSDSHLLIGDTTTVFWAESPSKIYADLACYLFSPPVSTSESIKDKRDRKTEQLIGDVLNNIKKAEV